MAATSARTLRLLSLLQHHRFWPGPELAGRLEVSARTLRRDVDRLRELGYPVESTRGIEGGYQLAAGATLPPLVLDNDEAIALVVGLHAAAHSGVADVAEPSLRALTKVVQMLPARLQRDAEALRSMTVSAQPSAAGAAVASDTLSVIAQACRDSVRLRFGYAARDGAASERTVEPYRLVTLGRRWYLVAYDMDRTEWRTFRADRMSAPDPSRNAFTPRPLPADDLVSYVQAGIAQLFTAHQVEIEVSANAERVQDVVGRWGTVTELGVGRCRLAMTTEYLDWLVVLLGTIDADFEVITPPALADLVARIGRRFSAAAAS